MNPFKSKKFNAFLGGVLIALGSALTGQIEWGKAIIDIVILVLGYVGVEGAVDVARIKAEIETIKLERAKAEIETLKLERSKGR
ncbi:MAG: hypothetical protein ACTSR2_02855 [Candidatus Hodarchaeales archaeon]